MTKRAISFLVLLLAAPPGRVRAQENASKPDVLDMSLEDLMNVEIDSVWGASGYKQRINNAPASITIVTDDEIQRYGYRTLADVLRNVPGFYVATDRVYNYLGERGFGRPGDYNSRFLVLVDGHRMNDNVVGGAYIGMDFPISIDLIERIEVIRGPNSATYIASALLGIINVVTKRPGSTEDLTTSGEWASYGTYKSSVTYSHRFKNGLDALVSGTAYGSQGPEKLYFPEFDSPGANNGIARNADGAQADQLFMKLAYGDFALEAAYGFSRQHDPTAPFGTIFNDPTQRTDWSPGYIDLSYDRNFGGDWGYQARLYYDNDHYAGVYPVEEPLAGSLSRVLNQDVSHGQDAGASFAISKTVAGEKFIAGAEYRDTFQQNQGNYFAQPYYPVLDSRESSTLWGVYVQDEIPIRRHLVLDLGLSHDHYSTFGGTTNPRAALIYQPLESTTFKFLYGQSFRAPTALELYYAIPGTEEANPHLKPETAKTMEIVWEQSLRKGFQFMASGYYYPVRSVINAVTDPVSGVLVFENTGRVDLRGAELTLKHQSRYGFEAGISVSFEDAKNLDGGPLSNSPRWLCQANLSVPLAHRKLFASVDLQYVSPRRTQAGGIAGSYVVPNFTLMSRRARWDLSASIYNAFNDRYGDPASIAHQEDVIQQNGRNFRLKFTYHF